MKVDRVRLYNFRNYQELDLSFSQGIHIFTGNNAQGKTNLLEALFLAVLGKSFRAGKDDELIEWGKQSAKIEVEFCNLIASHSLKVDLYRDGTRKNVLNGQAIKKRDIVGYLNAVLFFPEDLWLIKGSPSGRRRFIDLMISQVDRNYYQDFIKFNRIILQRNHLLKKIQQQSAKIKLLDIWDEQLIELAVKIYHRRNEVLQDLSEGASQIYAKITSGTEKFSAHYCVFGQDKNEKDLYRKWYQQRVVEGRNNDIRRGNTEIGPHKDDIIFMIDEYEAKLFGSQGQQRTAVLSLKLAEIEMMKQITGEYPILLLDDVMSELDGLRRERLIQEIDGKIQTFMTGTEKAIGLEKFTANYYSVSAGVVERM
jgi:DNA replication and repair protein RecF